MDTDLTVTEVMPGTYQATFTDFKSDKAANAAQAAFYLDQIKRGAAAHPGEKINVINDTRLISDKVKFLPADARASYLEAYQHPQIGHVAMVGFGPWLKSFIAVLATFASRTSQTAFFNTPEEATDWLKQIGK